MTASIVGAATDAKIACPVKDSISRWLDTSRRHYDDFAPED
jgi:hypothetical protein